MGRVEFPRSFDPEAMDLVRKLLVADRTKRYGCLKGGSADIKRHPFFASFDFYALCTGELKPPIEPQLTHDGDSRNFDNYDDPEEPKPHQVPPLPPVRLPPPWAETTTTKSAPSGDEGRS